MCRWDQSRLPEHTWDIVIEDVSYPSVNQLGGNAKNDHRYRKYRNLLAKLLKEQLSSIPRASKFRVGIITREYGKSKLGKQKRPYDQDNLVAGGKALIDNLRDYAVILNDDDASWRGYYRQERSPDGVDRIRIRLLEYP